MTQDQINFNKNWIKHCEELKATAIEELKNPRLRLPERRRKTIADAEEAIKDCLFRLYEAGVAL